MATNITAKAVNLLLNMTSSTISPNNGNITEGHHGNASAPVHEGGFLTGRNPFEFIPDVPLPTFIIQLLVIVCMSRVVKLILSPIKQPAVIAEIISGILLGPTAMGHIPLFTSTVFPPASLPFLNLMSNFGLVLFLFLVGLELDPVMLRKSISKSFLISLFGMVLPFILGCGTSYILYTFIEPPSHREKSFLSYLLFLGVAMSITAFPVLARILTELNLLKTKVGGITISAAAVDDATSWCLLALVISIIHANSNLTALYVFLMGLGYSIILILVVRPIFIGCLRKFGVFDQETPSQASIFFALMLVFVSAFITDAIGIHAIFGGFIAGIIMPHERGFAYHITEKLEDVVQILFLPLYFALSGLKTKIGALDDPLSWAVVVLVIFAACFGKIMGCTMAARLTRMSWRESFAVGTLMNCKGLVELIVLNLGYDSGVISDKTFAIMVIMALVTTFITVPIVSYVYPPEMHEILGEGGNGVGEGDKKKGPVEPSLLVSVNRIEQVGPLLSVVNLMQHQMNSEKMAGEERKGSKDSNKSFSSLADLIQIIPGGGGGGGRKGGPMGVMINVLRLIELTDRDSSVMLSANQTALVNDPITKLLKTFCGVTNKANCVEGMVKVVTMEMFGRVLAKAGEEANAKYILLPWGGAGSVVENKPVRRWSGVGGRRFSVSTGERQVGFFGDLMGETRRNLLVFVDRGGPVINVDGRVQLPGDVGRKMIFLPFFGGEDDRLALEIGMGLRDLENVRVRVVRYKNKEGKGWETLSVGGGEGDDVGEGQGHGQQVAIQMEDKDEEAIRKWFGGKGKGGEKGVGVGVKVNFGGDVEETVKFEEVECENPVTQALQQLGQLGGSDLVLVGRSSLLGGGGGAAGGEGGKGDKLQHRFEDGERRKVLGEFAEAAIVCQCAASLLVVHSGQQ